MGVKKRQGCKHCKKILIDTETSSDDLWLLLGWDKLQDDEAVSVGSNASSISASASAVLGQVNPADVMAFVQFMNMKKQQVRQQNEFRSLKESIRQIVLHLS